MPSVFSIENLNLNGGLLTTDNDFLYLNGNRIYFESGLPTKDNLFIKGYSPLNFYSRIAIHGTYLNEIYLNEEFIATGWLITCSQPGTGNASLAGRFYSRSPSSVIETQTIQQFDLPNTQVFKQSNPFFHKVFGNKVIGLDILSIPAEMESISINLLGYFAGAGHFDKIPKVVNYYKPDHLETGLNRYEEYLQYDTTYTGIGIFADKSGVGPSIINKQDITGYISGILNEYALYSKIAEPIGISGYFLSGVKYRFPTGNNFSGFSGETGFDPYWGFEYSGFEISRSGNNIFSGYESNSPFGSGELLEVIGTRNYTIPEKIIGFRSGTVDEYFVFSGFTGTSGLQQKINGFLSGYMDEFGNFTGLHLLDLSSGSSGYYLNGLVYTFQTGDSFSGFSGQPNFNSNIGFDYTGFDFPEGSGFSGIEFLDSGYGIMTGYIGHRNITNSGYFISGIPYYFPTGNFISGFSGESNFDDYLGYLYTGFSFPEGVGFSGMDFPNSGTGILTGFIGSRNIITGKELISGFITIFSDYDFEILTGLDFVSGYFLDDLKIGFSTGLFSGFDNQSGFYPEWNYEYTGFFPLQSGFSGLNFINSGTGIMTGIIGYRNIPYLAPMSGSFYYKDNTGNKNYIQSFSIDSGVNFYSNTGIYVKVTNNKRIGLDIYHTLSGLSDVNICMMGFYD